MDVTTHLQPMELIHAIVYGIFQGIFAYLPVSSDAQIRLIQALAGWQGDESPVFAGFTAVIQVGPTLAVIFFLRKEVVEALKGIGSAFTGEKKDSAEARMGLSVVIGTIPIIVLGLGLQKLIEKDFRSLYVIAASLIVGAVIMYMSDRAPEKEKRGEEDVQLRDGILVGLWQCLALIPGMSRSGCTISGALFQGFNRPDAARFAFLLGIPSFSAAGIYELAKYHKQLLGMYAKPLAVAFVISFVVAYGCLSWFLGFLQKRGVAPFVWYRIVLGGVILALMFTKSIS